jgi:multiple sugar transport system permease protein
MAVAAARKRRFETLGNAKLREALVGYAFVVLPLGFFFLFFIFPMVYAFYISRYDWGVLGPIENVGFQNYRELYHDELFRRALRNILVYTAVVTLGQVALGLTAAVIVNQKIRGRPFFRSAFYFPSLASSAAIAAIFIYLLNANGLVNAILGTHITFFSDSDTALPSIMGMNIWTTSGTIMLFYLAALQAIPPDVYEAAAIDASGPWRTFWKITFPLLKPAHFFVLVVSIIGCLKVFDQMYIVSGGTGGPNYSTLSVVLYMYQTAISDLKWGYASTIGVVLFLIIFVFTLVQRLLFGRAEVS